MRLIAQLAAHRGILDQPEDPFRQAISVTGRDEITFLAVGQHFGNAKYVGAYNSKLESHGFENNSRKGFLEARANEDIRDAVEVVDLFALLDNTRMFDARLPELPFKEFKIRRFAPAQHQETNLGNFGWSFRLQLLDCFDENMLPFSRAGRADERYHDYAGLDPVS